MRPQATMAVPPVMVVLLPMAAPLVTVVLLPMAALLVTVVPLPMAALLVTVVPLPMVVHPAMAHPQAMAALLHTAPQEPNPKKQKSCA
ncbi:MAG TPA: hypothetical protein DCO71_03000 [Gammaproteobacteria bacterium]|nr:hypothetical protein [Gammaproteobacteria bacterium]